MNSASSRILERLGPRGLVFAGGMVGTGARLATTGAFGSGEGFPWATMTVNLAGAALLGWLLPRLMRSARPASLTIPFFAIGVLGGFTTFSTMAVESVILADNGHTATAAVYVTTSVVAGVVLALAARRLSERTS